MEGYCNCYGDSTKPLTLLSQYLDEVIKLQCSNFRLRTCFANHSRVLGVVQILPHDLMKIAANLK